MEENKIPPDSSSYTKSFIDRSHQKYCEAAQTVLSCMGFLAEQLPMKLPLIAAAAAAAKLLQSYPTLCNPIDIWQPTRLPLPWDSPGKNTGVGFLPLLSSPCSSLVHTSLIFMLSTFKFYHNVWVCVFV